MSTQQKNQILIADGWCEIYERKGYSMMKANLKKSKISNLKKRFFEAIVKTRKEFPYNDFDIKDVGGRTGCYIEDNFMAGIKRAIKETEDNYFKSKKSIQPPKTNHTQLKPRKL
jgi:hypothetical protein